MFLILNKEKKKEKERFPVAPYFFSSFTDATEF